MGLSQWSIENQAMTVPGKYDGGWPLEIQAGTIDGGWPLEIQAGTIYCILYVYIIYIYLFIYVHN